MPRSIIFFTMITLCSTLFASECENKIKQIQKEIEYAKAHKNDTRASHLQIALNEVESNCKRDPMFYDKKLKIKNQREQEIEKIEQDLKNLEKNKHLMSKTEYKKQKRELKRKKDIIKDEADASIDNL